LVSVLVPPKLQSIDSVDDLPRLCGKRSVARCQIQPESAKKSALCATR
jgi:hypothetical protein